MECRAVTSVLYDVPGPKARRRNLVFGVVTVLIVLAILVWVVWRLAATGQFAAAKWSIFGYTRIWRLLGDGVLHTLGAFALAGVGSLIVGLLLGVGRLSDHIWLRRVITWVVEVLRAIPVLVFMMLLYYGLPIAGLRVPPYWAVVIALIAYNGSVLSEVLRAGIESLPRGQKEAGLAIGLRKTEVMRSILLPQAIRAMMPVIVAQLVVTLKDTALGFIITYPELLYVIKLLGSNAAFGSPLIPTAIVGGSIYVVLCLLLSYVAYRLQRRARRSPMPGVDRAITTTEAIATRTGGS
jgi:glutamate transport system permease protein